MRGGKKAGICSDCYWLRLNWNIGVALVALNIRAYPKHRANNRPKDDISSIAS